MRIELEKSPLRGTIIYQHTTVRLVLVPNDGLSWPEQKTTSSVRFSIGFMPLPAL